ncbi:hypothetical protein [Novosphingobium sp. ST904]|uniref:hypothetical protein n=1 Tax=Novosphingobium sp. ST904 TaxID=1684385 RepID=UPI0006CD85DF|nr:hypothetical protein [Novosphingobium sp. ST904]KPH62309.1 hypothetical protein ADT71_15315 [Novosphingobium sp. ST904]TCM43354.1 hypothetical protein EDF59_101458 [Novosphingobium sp. ST904]
MRLKHPALAQRAAALPMPFEFECSACGTVERRCVHALPDGWGTEVIGDVVHAYCPDDAQDLPGRSVQ